MRNIRKKLIIIIDKNHLRLFEGIGFKITKQINEIQVEHKHPHPGLRQSFRGNSVSAAAHFFDPHTDADEVELEEHAKTIIEHLKAFYSQTNEFASAILVAAPKMLGLVRKNLDQKIKNIITKEIPKDLSYHDKTQIEKIVFAA
jgi:protein required for attachment to host cells